MYVVKLLFICQNYIIKLELSISDIGGEALHGLVCDLALGQGDGVGFQCSWAQASSAERPSWPVVKAHVPVVVPPPKGIAVGVHVLCVMDHTVDGTILVRFMFDGKLHPINGYDLF